MKKCEKFDASFERTKHTNSAVLNDNVTVISVFGKSSYLASSCKVNFIDKLLGYNVFHQLLMEDVLIKSDVLCDIEGYFDTRENVIYLHLRGSYDANSLAKILDEYCVQIEEKGYLSIWTDLNYKYARAVLFLFYVSHVLIITHPTHVFDLSYIKLFRALDTIRSKLQTQIIDIIKVIPDVCKTWRQNGRLCSPRVLFYFEKCPPEFKQRNNSVNENTDIKSLEHAIEDQIYRILKKSKIVGNTSYNTLFAIPANQEFVFVETNEDIMHDWKNFCVNSVINSCFEHNLPSNTEHCSFGYENVSEIDSDGRIDHSVRLFLKMHIDTAFTNGFDDNLNRHAGTNNYFELCKARVWFEVAQKVYNYLVCQEKTDNEDDCFNMLHAILDTDQRFSLGRCLKVFPIAVKTYQENSPSHYTKAYHESKAEQALSVFLMYARGSCVHSYIPALQKEFEKYWKRGRQMCEVLSLTGHPCNLPLHKGGTGDFSSNEPDESVSIDDLPVMEHSSGVRYISTCNCGRRQSSREDPFSVRAANYEFYVKLGGECGCSMLQNLEFPIFTPSTTDYKAAKLLHTAEEEVAEVSSKNNVHTSSGLETTIADNVAIHELTLAAYPSCNSMDPAGSDVLSRDDHRRDLHLMNDVLNHQLLNKPSPTTSLTPSMQNIVIQVTDTDSDVEKSDDNLVRQPSTTEYLPGMLHSESPVGLLPQFPSWSLICIGSSSLYSHNIGLQEHYSTGYIAGSSYLLPWDVTVRLTHHTKERFWNDRNKTPLRTNRRKGTKEFSVKIFVGNEYECPRGHRFTCCSPDKILKATGTGIVRDSGSKVANCDMPLYFPCPCRNSKPLIAQLMRIHIVTPKAPVHVTLNPRVQPAPSSCPIFITGVSEPFRLSQSAYWILRLPYVYYGDRGPFIPPKDSLPSMYGKLLAGMYGIVEMSPDS